MLTFTTIDELYQYCQDKIRHAYGRTSRSRDDLQAVLQTIEELTWPLTDFQASAVVAALFRKKQGRCWVQDVDVTFQDFADAYDGEVDLTIGTDHYDDAEEALEHLPPDLAKEYTELQAAGNYPEAFKVYLYDFDGRAHPEVAYMVFCPNIGGFGVAWGADASWYQSSGDWEHDLVLWRRGIAPSM